MMAFKERMYLRSFQEISKVLSSTLSVEEVLDHIVRQTTDVMNLKGATIRLVNPKTNQLELAAAHGLSEKYLNKGTVDLDKSVTDALSGRPVAIFDAVNDQRMQYPQEAKEEGIATLVAIPMVSKGQVIGVMRLVTAEPREFTMEEVDFARPSATPRCMKPAPRNSTFSKASCRSPRRSTPPWTSRRSSTSW